MKLLKKMFGAKPKKISRYESNTLAELNESPDWRRSEIEDDEESKIENVKKATQKKATNTKAKTNRNSKKG